MDVQHTPREIVLCLNRHDWQAHCLLRESVQSKSSQNKRNVYFVITASSRLIDKAGVYHWTLAPFVTASPTTAPTVLSTPASAAGAGAGAAAAAAVPKSSIHQRRTLELPVAAVTVSTGDCNYRQLAPLAGRQRAAAAVAAHRGGIIGAPAPLSPL